LAEQPNRTLRRYIAWLCVALLVIVADQITKWAIIEWVPRYGRVPVNSFINLTHQQNTGAAFSFLAGAGGRQRGFFLVRARGAGAPIGGGLWGMSQERPPGLRGGGPTAFWGVATTPTWTAPAP